jgi:hypothetical protein
MTRLARLQNANGVILQLQGVKVGVELSASVSGVQIAMKGPDPELIAGINHRSP